LSSRKKLQAALVCIDPWTGGVLAMVGGRDYYDTAHNGEWNRAVQGKRQSGSTFKPFVYATAMEQGFTPNSPVLDSPLRVLNNREVRRGGHEIKNYDFIHRGWIPLYKAIGVSDNVAAVRVLMKVGIQNVVEKAHLMGIESPLVPVPTLALGTSDISLLENTSAFGVFATRGLRAEETPIDHINGPDGETIIETEKPVRGARVLSQEAGNKMWQMLRYVVADGTGQQAQIDGVEVIGKTGTTSNNKDVWFMGATKQLVTGVWIGYDRPSELYGSSGGKWSAPLWRSFMVKALDTWRQRNVVATMIEDARSTTLAKRNAEQTKKYVMRRICDESGLLAISGCPDAHMVEFSASGDVPTQICAIPEHVQRTQEMQDKSGRPRPGDLGYDDPNSQSGSASSPRDMTARSEARDATQSSAGTGDSVPENSAPPADATSNMDGATGNSDDDFGTARNQNTAYDAQSEAARRAAIRMAAANEYANAVSSAVAPADESDGGNEVLVRLCADSGELARRNCSVTVERFFAPDEVPRKLCTQHR
ncbi:MAG TPA: penicillin-binding transpeptidase domain-containing protein, partial [Abditibacteriaceae bacterium]|nr:penicillin-binding transpeptidase domain-containing protein [Abditibacteriaceae bacterium]